MANRYWVGGTAAWDGTAGTKWALTSGGAGGQAVPTSADDVFFDAASGANTVTISTGNTGAKSITCTGFTGTLAGTAAITLSGSITLVAGMTFSYTGTVTIAATATITSAGKTFNGISVNGTGITVTLGDPFVVASSITVSAGTFTTNNNNVNAGSLLSSAVVARTINFGSSTVTLSSSTPISFTTSTNLTFNAGTSSVTCSNSNATFAGGGQTFNNVTFSSTALSSPDITGANTFANLTVAGRAASGIALFGFAANQSITGTFTVSAGTDATCRTFIRSNTENTVRTLTCAAVSLTDVDFRDITIAGAAAPASGTRLGDCKGNSGITFPAGVNKYWASTAGGNWSDSAVWALSSGGSTAVNNFPLAQDTVNIQQTYPTSGTITVNANYNLGTISMGTRTSSVTLATSTNAPICYGSWTNGSGVTLSGTGSVSFNGRGAAQTITSAGKTFTMSILIVNYGGSVTLLDSFVCSDTVLTITSGTFDANGFNVTLNNAAATVSSSNSNVRTIAIGSGTWTIAGSGTPWSCATSTNLTVTGTGTLSFTSASAKIFAGGGIQTYPTLNQGGAGTLTVTGSNKFADITNTYSATGATSVLFTAGTTNIFTAFNLKGEAGRVCTLGSPTAAQATLQKSSTWYMGANSTDAGNNTNLTFTAGGGIDYLSVSYINGTVAAAILTGIINEAASALDLNAVTIITSGLVNETASGIDSTAATIIANVLISEAASAVDSVLCSLAFAVIINEAASALESLGGGSVYNISVTEVASAQDQVSNVGTFNITITEAATGVAILTARLLWEPIDDQQTPDWTTIGTTQSPNWTNINDTQIPGWTDIPTQ